MKQEDKDALGALKDFMVAVGATPEDIKGEVTKAMDMDKELSKEDRLEIEKAFGLAPKATNDFKPIDISEVKRTPSRRIVPNPPSMSKTVTSKPVCKLHAPARYGLSELLSELKFGRTAAEQNFLDASIREFEEFKKQEVEKEIYARLEAGINSSLRDLAILDVTMKQARVKKLLIDVKDTITK